MKTTKHNYAPANYMPCMHAHKPSINYGPLTFYVYAPSHYTHKNEILFLTITIEGLGTRLCHSYIAVHFIETCFYYLWDSHQSACAESWCLLPCAHMCRRVKHLVPSICIYIYMWPKKLAVLYFGDHKLSQKLVYCLLLRFDTIDS